MCTELRRLASTVTELRLGRMSVSREYACDTEYFNSSTHTFTLVGRRRSRRGERWTVKCLTSSSALQEHPLSLSQYSIQSKVVHVAKNIDSLNSTHQFCMKATLGECISVYFKVPT